MSALALTAALALSPTSPATAASTRVEATDDALAPGTCPESNSFGLPTGGNCFAPDVVTVEVGTTVEWASVGKRPHDVVADDGTFQSQYLYPGDRWEWRFEAVGEFPYFCSLHGDRGGVGHAGKIVVVEAGAAPQTVPGAGGAPPPGAGPVPAPGTASGAQGGNQAAPPLVDTNIQVAVRRVPGSQPESPGPSSGGGMASFWSALAITLMLVAAWRWAVGDRSA